ncbi:MAG: hypothetical protein Q9176_003877 [Flavoplaca citrina]
MALYDQLTLSTSHREFRVLALFAGESSDDLRGELLRASIDNNNVSFTTLSYTWGDPSNPGSIKLGRDPISLPITRNLEAALRQFRSPTNSLRLWVDAICINQADPDEKSVQVALMREIYVSARETWVWLGPPSHDSDRAMDMLQSFQNRHPYHNELGQVSQEHWDGIGSLMRRSWWTRIWVIQEVLSSMRVDVWCGRKRIGFGCFVRLEEIRRDFAFRHIPTQPFANILSIWSLNQQIVRRGDAPLFEWMADTHKFESTLRRDRIYALLGLSSQESRNAVIPDYSSRTSDTLLSTRATAHFLIEQKMLLPLQAGFFRKAADLDLPSWVSDWSTSQAGYVTFVFGSAYNACGRYSTTIPRFSPPFEHLSDCPEDGSLILRGVLEGVINSAFPMPEVPSYSGSNTEEDLRSRMLRREVTRLTCRDWKEICDQNSSSDQPNLPESYYAAFWRTIIADRMFDGSGPPGLEHGRYFEDWQAGIDSDGVTDFRNAAVSRCAGRSFIRCRDGRSGLAPRNAQEGDIVCLFHGGDVPFVLRPLDSARYTFVGEAFVYGIMQGEHSHRLCGLDLRDFEIL